MIDQNSPVSTRLMAVDDAIASGAMALFGEKYGDEVRVVSMGDPGSEGAKPWSVELCGGTHVKATGDIGVVRVVSEGAVASGVRRIEALTGQAARDYLRQQEERLRQIAAALKTSPAEALDRLTAILDERRRMERELTEARRKLALGGGGAAAQDGPETIGDIAFLGKVLDGVSPKDLKPLVDEAKQSIGSGVITFVGRGEDGKASVVVGVTSDMTDRADAVALVREASAALGGKGGGGRPDMAQAGGPDAAKAEEALEAVRAALRG